MHPRNPHWRGPIGGTAAPAPSLGNGKANATRNSKYSIVCAVLQSRSHRFPEAGVLGGGCAWVEIGVHCLYSGGVAATFQVQTVGGVGGRHGGRGTHGWLHGGKPHRVPRRISGRPVHAPGTSRRFPRMTRATTVSDCCLGLLGLLHPFPGGKAPSLARITPGLSPLLRRSAKTHTHPPNTLISRSPSPPRARAPPPPPRLNSGSPTQQACMRPCPPDGLPIMGEVSGTATRELYARVVHRQSLF